MGSGRKQVKPPDPGAKLAPDSPFFSIIKDAYRVFSDRKPPAIGVCEGCCMYPEIEADFFNPERAQLPLAYVRDWFFAAADMPMPKPVWEYLLPRVLEILACGEDPSSVGIEVSLSRFPTGDAAQWSTEQFAVLERFAAQFIDCQKTSTRDYLDDVLCMFGTAAFDLRPLLALIEAWSDADLATKLHADWGHPYGGSIWITAFWEAPLNSQVFAWYTSRALYDRMVAFGMAGATPRALSRKALDVADIIEANADWAQPAQT